MTTTKQIGVVGSGLAGLTAACTLAARGHQVTVFEKNSWLGGKAAVLEENGFRFDMGPTILTLPSVLRRVFGEAGRKLEDYVNLVELDPQWRCFYDDGSRLDLMKSPEAMAGEISQLTGQKSQGDRYHAFINYSKILHEMSDKYYFWRSIESLRDMLLNGSLLDTQGLKYVSKMGLSRSLAQTVRKYAPDPRVAQLLDHFTQYVGSSPGASPSILASIAHMQVAEGITYPIGGTRAIPEALVKLAGELGVEFCPNTEIVQFHTSGARVVGLTDQHGRRYDFSAIVSNSDAIRTYTELIGEEKNRGFNPNKYEAACSGIVLYLGLDRRYEQLEHHNFVFSRDAEEEFTTIYDKGEPAPDPTCYVCAPAKTEPAVAPEGGEALYVLVHTPYLRSHHDWSVMFPEQRAKIIAKLESCAGLENLEQHIVSESYLTPQDIHDRYRVLNGAIYGLASHGKVNGAFKPGNRSRQFENLYLAGGAAHPGPGMPMVMMSGWIAADCYDADSQVSATA